MPQKEKNFIENFDVFEAATIETKLNKNENVSTFI